MNSLLQLETLQITYDTFALPGYCPTPGLGVLPMTSFIIRGAQPVLVDAGPGPLADDLMCKLGDVLDPASLRWIWLTHTDPDHIGAVEEVLAAAPQARVVTTFLGVGKMGLHRPLPEDRTYLLNPGQSLDIGDRKLIALRPPIYDAPETIAAFDTRTRALFAADCFGALMDGPVQSAAELSRDCLCDGLVKWASIDAPWLAHIERHAFESGLDELRRLEPKYVLGAHLPPAEDMVEVLTEYLALAPGIAPFVGPDQKAMESMVAAAV